MTDNTEKILVVEDRDDSRLLLSLFLASQGFSVAGCSTLKDAQNVLTEEFFDLIITDLHLPDGNGSELSRYGTPAIAVTADDSPDGQSQSRRKGMLVHLTKPVSLDQLLDVVRLILTPSAGTTMLH